MSTRESGRPARRAATSARARASTTPKGRRKKRPTEDLIGRRIQISWPGDDAPYEARCVDFNSKSKLHKLLYFVDDSIEELSLAKSKRKWKVIEEPIPDPDPEGRHALVGQRIILPVMSSEEINPAEPVQDFRACVLRILETEESADSEDPPDPTDPPSDSNEPTFNSAVLHQVVYLANDFIANVDLSNVRFTVVDKVTGLAVRVVNPDKGCVELEPPEGLSPVPNGEAETAPKEGAPAEAQATAAVAASAGAPVVPATAVVGATEAAGSLTPTEGSTAPVPGTSLRTKNASASPRTAKAGPVVEEEDLSSGDASSHVIHQTLKSKNQAGMSTSSAVPEASESGVNSSKPVSTAETVKGASSAPMGIPSSSVQTKVTSGAGSSAIVLDGGPVTSAGNKPVSQGQSTAIPVPKPGAAITSPKKSVAQGPPKPADPIGHRAVIADVVPGGGKLPLPSVTPKKTITDTDSGAMADQAAAAAAAMRDINTSAKNANVADALPDVAFDSQAPLASGSNAKLAAGALRGSVSPGTAKPLSSASNTVFDALNKELQQPLTAENLNLLDSEITTSKTPHAAGGVAADAKPVKDEDTQTVSDAEDPLWIEGMAGGSHRVGENLVHSYVSIRSDNQKPRQAYVEAYFPQKQTHLIAFCDSTGGNMQLRLTKDNHRVLTKEEVDVLTKRLALNDSKRPAKRSNRAGPSKATGSREGSEKSPAFKRRRIQSNGEPGAELIGTCITVRWPENGGNYVALVVGFQDNGVFDRKHKLYYVVDESTEVLDLSEREWVKEGPGTEPWDRNGLVGKRLFVLWDAVYSDNHSEDQKRAEEMYGKGKTQLPFEAFVVQFIDSFRYKLLYTQEDHLEDRDLTQDDNAWDVLEAGAMRVRGLPVISWSSSARSM